VDWGRTQTSKGSMIRSTIARIQLATVALQSVWS
jgi:hypothetical protein